MFSKTAVVKKRGALQDVFKDTSGKEERRLTRCSQRQQWSRREAPYKMFSKTQVVQKRGSLQDVLKVTSKEVRTKASKVEDAKRDLDRPYAEEQEEYVIGKIQKFELAHESYETSSARSMVNEISGRKGCSCCRSRASCPKERIKLWKEHFDGLLEQPPSVDGPHITRVSDSLPTKTGDFTMT